MHGKSKCRRPCRLTLVAAAAAAAAAIAARRPGRPATAASADIAALGPSLAEAMAFAGPNLHRHTARNGQLPQGFGSATGYVGCASAGAAATAAIALSLIRGSTLRAQAGSFFGASRGQHKLAHRTASFASADPLTSAPGDDDAAEAGRRAVLGLAGSAALALGTDSALRASDERYALFGTIIPPAPYKTTLRTELVPGKIWGFEQCIALVSVSTNIRMTAVKLRDGTLWVSAPISPTRECLRQLDELGEVSHLVVPSTALEHKASLTEFAKIYPKASVWVSPGQSAFSLGLPSRAQVLGKGQPPPWVDEIAFKVFFVEPPVTDVFAEVAFFHRETETLLVTDCALKLPQKPPPVLESYGYDGTPGPISPEQWRYKAIAFNFVTARGRDEADFAALSSPAAIVNPLLRFLVYRRCPTQAAAWVQDVASWGFRRIIPAHLQAPFDCTPAEFLEAFGFLFDKRSSWEPDDEQLSFLRFLREQVGGPTF